jgi:hypothetical protein
MPEQQVSSAAEFTVVIEGPAVSRTYPLVSVSSILLNATTILRDSAIEIISPTVKEVEIDLEAGFPREGSYVQDVVLKVMEFVSEKTAPIVQAIPITDIVKHANETLNLAEHFRKFWRQHKDARVERVENGDALVVGGDGETLPLPQKSLKDIEATLRILSELDQSRLRSVEIRTPDSTEVRIKYEPASPISSAEMRQLNAALRRLTREAKYGGAVMLAADTVAALPPSEPSITLRGQIRELDFDSRTGRLRVLDGTSIPEGTYTFELVGEQSLIDIKSLLGESTVLVDCIAKGRGKRRRLLVYSVRPAR